MITLIQILWQRLVIRFHANIIYLTKTTDTKTLLKQGLRTERHTRKVRDYLQGRSQKRG